MSEDMGRELGWDDVIEKESDFTLLPEGEYPFVVIEFERGRHNGSEKLPPCNKVTVHVRIEGAEGETTVKNNFFLHTKTEGMLSAFFTSIGLKKKGEPLRMNWSQVPGCKGRAKVGIRKFTNTDGKEMEFNEIRRFLEPASPAPTNFTPGSF